MPIFFGYLSAKWSLLPDTLRKLSQKDSHVYIEMYIFYVDCFEFHMRIFLASLSEKKWKIWLIWISSHPLHFSTSFGRRRWGRKEIIRVWGAQVFHHVLLLFSCEALEQCTEFLSKYLKHFIKFNNENL